MNNIPTPHISVTDKSEFASTVLMPGDPLRAKFIAENFLENAKQINSVRNMFAYTGTYHGKKISVMGSGMGMPSIGIYSYELFKFYDVQNIIRIGSAGSYTADLKLYDVVLAESSYSESTYAKTQAGKSVNEIKSSVMLNDKLKKAAQDLDIPLKTGKIHSSDVFYKESFDFAKFSKETGCLAVEMESFALFHNANILGKNASCLLTISDCLVTNEVTTAEERQTAFTNMMKIALEV